MATKTILITGCSQGGLGDALAQALKRRGHRVIATARNPSKMSHFAALDIETLPLDVLSTESVEQCVSTVTKQLGGRLDMLINNSGGGYSTPLADASIPESRRLFDLNVWSVLAVTQAFLPLLLQSQHGAMVVNNTSVASVVPNPWMGIYNASKAAAAALTDNLRLELKPFNIRVVELKTGSVKSKFFDNLHGGPKATLPDKSIYVPAKDVVESYMRGAAGTSSKVDADKWAEQVAGDLLASNPAAQVWRGGDAFLVWVARTFLPWTFVDGLLEKRSGLHDLKARLALQQDKKAI